MCLFIVLTGTSLKTIGISKVVTVSIQGVERETNVTSSHPAGFRAIPLAGAVR